jgi:hypothetical protein
MNPICLIAFLIVDKVLLSFCHGGQTKKRIMYLKNIWNLEHNIYNIREATEITGDFSFFYNIFPYTTSSRQILHH